MPPIFLDRMPLPSLRTYTAFSVFLLTCALFYSYHIINNTPVYKSETHLTQPGNLSIEKDSTEFSEREDIRSFLGLTKPNEDLSNRSLEKFNNMDNKSLSSQMNVMKFSFNRTLPHDNYALNVLFVLSVEVWGIWILINTAYCSLILLAKLIQVVVFGELRVIEHQNLRDRFWNFVFYKFIFVFGVMNVQRMEEVTMWVAWFTALGFFTFLTQLSKDRFEFVTSSPTTPNWIHLKILCLLTLILSCMVAFMVISVTIGYHTGFSILTFLATECLLIGLKALYIVVRYIIHLFDMNQDGIWENRSSYVYYTELVFELITLSVDFAHHLRMLLWGNIFLSMASLVICMHLRYLMYEFQRRYKRHKNYLSVLHKVQSRFPMASQKEIEENSDNCAICWEKMETARKLPCSHLYHNSCLRSWLEHDTSCPTCRVNLSESVSSPDDNENRDRPSNPDTHRRRRMREYFHMNHFFHFDASRYVSWLPSFSVEVSHTRPLLSRTQPAEMQSSRLDNMVDQVQSIFPQVLTSAILEDLQMTQNVDDTIENILEGRISNHMTSAVSESSLSSSDNEQVVIPSVVSRTGARALQAAMIQSQDNSIPELLNEGSDVMASSSSHSVSDVTADSTEFSEELPTSSCGSRFSKSPSERESMLRKRKFEMMELARRQYLGRGPSQ